MLKRDSGDWTTIIKPKDKLLEIDLREIWQYRDLFTMFVKRDIITQYKQTILGPAWFFIQPALTTLIYMVVFGGIAGISTDNLPQPLFYLSGIVCWQYFADCINKTSSTFTSNQSIFGKVYFPRLIVPLSVIISNLIRFGIQLLLFLGFYLYYYYKGVTIKTNEYVFLVPFLIFLLAGLSMGFGIIISSMTTKYRDLTIFFTFMIQLWMYGTPIIYPLSAIPGKLQKVISLNPVTPIVEAFRFGTLGTGTFSWLSLGYSFLFMTFLLVAGVIIFNKVQKSFMDTI